MAPVMRPPAMWIVALAVGQQRHDGVEGAVVHQLQRAREVFHGRAWRSVLRMWVSGASAAQRSCLAMGFCSWAESSRAELLLKGGKAGKAQLLGQAQHGGGGDIGLAREVGDAAQARHRIVGEQGRHQLALGGGQLARHQAQAFGNGGGALRRHDASPQCMAASVTNLTALVQSEIIASHPTDFPGDCVNGSLAPGRRGKPFHCRERGRAARPMC